MYYTLKLLKSKKKMQKKENTQFLLRIFALIRY